MVMEVVLLFMKWTWGECGLLWRANQNIKKLDFIPLHIETLYILFFYPKIMFPLDLYSLLEVSFLLAFMYQMIMAFTMK